MIGHQAVDMTKHIEPSERLPEDGQEGVPVDAIDKSGGLGIAAERHVTDGSWGFYAVGSWPFGMITEGKSRLTI